MLSAVVAPITLPMDIVNHIVMLSAIQQDKMYAPYFNENGRCFWKWNRKSSLIEKIEKVCKTKIAYPPDTRVLHLDNNQYTAIAYTLTTDGNGRKLEYIQCETNVPETEMYLVMQWTTIHFEHYIQPYLEKGLIYSVYNRGYELHRPEIDPVYWNGYLFYKRIFREVYTGTYWEFFSMPNIMGKYIYDTKSDIYEFVITMDYSMEPEEENDDDEHNHDEYEVNGEEVVYGNSGDLPDDLDELFIE
jgi:hypothetical protein